MVRTNKTIRSLFTKTHEGGRAAPERGPLALAPRERLMRAVATCLLFEDTFYESGSEIAANIRDLAGQVDLATIAEIAQIARTDLRLRHAPLFLLVQMAKRRGGALTANAIAETIARPDELCELVALYFIEAGRETGTLGHTKIPAAMKRGLAAAFTKFDAYQLSKWDRADRLVKLRDVLFLCHAKPKDAAQAETWKKLIDGSLPAADTWEVAISRGDDKRETWTRLLNGRKLGYMAVLMNLRNMSEAGVDTALVRKAILDGAARGRALPFRYVAAAKAAPQFADALSDAMVSAIKGKLDGTTLLVIDVSGSMVGAPLSMRSMLDRLDAAGALAIYLRELCPEVRVFAFSNDVTEMPNLRGLGLHGALRDTQHGGTMLAQALKTLRDKGIGGARTIVVTDEQAHDGIVAPWTEHAYLVNVAPYKPGLDVSQGWHRVSGWSERIVDWIAYEETSQVIDARPTGPTEDDGTDNMA